MFLYEKLRLLVNFLFAALQSPLMYHIVYATEHLCVAVMISILYSQLLMLFPFKSGLSWPTAYEYRHILRLATQTLRSPSTYWIPYRLRKTLLQPQAWFICTWACSVCAIALFLRRNTRKRRYTEKKQQQRTRERENKFGTVYFLRSSVHISRIFRQIQPFFVSHSV